MRGKFSFCLLVLIILPLIGCSPRKPKFRYTSHMPSNCIRPTVKQLDSTHCDALQGDYATQHLFVCTDVVAKIDCVASHEEKQEVK
jgi:hypothetical protein